MLLLDLKHSGKLCEDQIMKKKKMFSAVAAAGTRAVRDTSAGRGKPAHLAAEPYVLVV